MAHPQPSNRVPVLSRVNWVAHPLQLHRKGWVAVAVAFALAVACPFCLSFRSAAKESAVAIACPFSRFKPKITRHLDRSNRQSHRLLRSGEIPHFAFFLSFASRYPKASALGLYTSAEKGL
jgi:hypothetical protein